MLASRPAAALLRAVAVPQRRGRGLLAGPVCSAERPVVNAAAVEEKQAAAGLKRE